tara:strand:+ start:219 stop:632 length:414 start_codon:yes stop_codon:yes gene_type:complete
MSNLLGCPFPPNPRVAGLMPYACSTARSSYPNETYADLKKLSGGKKSRRAGKKTRKGGSSCMFGGKKSRKGGYWVPGVGHPQQFLNVGPHENKILNVGPCENKGGRKSRRGGKHCTYTKGGGHCHKKHRKKQQSKKH